MRVWSWVTLVAELSTCESHPRPRPHTNPSSPSSGTMTGFSALPSSSSSTPGASWLGVARIKGPKWARMPLLTVGMLGLQIVWSVEMGYGAHIATISSWFLTYEHFSTPVSPLFGPIQGPHVHRIRGWTLKRSHHAATDWRVGGPFNIAFWSETTLHARRLLGLCRRDVFIGLHKVVLGHIHLRRHEGCQYELTTRKASTLIATCRTIL